MPKIIHATHPSSPIMWFQHIMLSLMVWYQKNATSAIIVEPWKMTNRMQCPSTWMEFRKNVRSPSVRFSTENVLLILSHVIFPSLSSWHIVDSLAPVSTPTPTPRNGNQ